MKTIEGKGVAAHSLICNTSKVKGVWGSFKMGTRKSDKCVNYSYQYAQTKQ
jgi:hypothetical protein